MPHAHSHSLTHTHTHVHACAYAIIRPHADESVAVDNLSGADLWALYMAQQQPRTRAEAVWQQTMAKMQDDYDDGNFKFGVFFFSCLSLVPLSCAVLLVLLVLRLACKHSEHIRGLSFLIAVLSVPSLSARAPLNSFASITCGTAVYGPRVRVYCPICALCTSTAPLMRTHLFLRSRHLTPSSVMTSSTAVCALLNALTQVELDYRAWRCGALDPGERSSQTTMQLGLLRTLSADIRRNSIPF